MSSPKHIKTFLLIAYGFSFALWFIAWYVANRVGVDVLLNNEIYFWKGDSWVLGVSLLFSLATLGPLIGALAVRKESHITLGLRGFKNTLLVFGILLALQMLLTFGVRLFAPETFGASRVSFRALLFALLYFALTSGTEEFGWRGVLYPHVKEKTASLWDSAVVTGLIWGPWHTPFVLYLFVEAELPFIGIITSYVGFIMTIIFMSYLHGWVNVRGGSTLGNYLLHILHNWLPVLMLFVFAETALASIASIGAYLLTITVLERFFPSKRYFEGSLPS